MECHTYRGSLSHQMQKSDEDRRKQRKRNALILILDYLETNGYLIAASQLRSEIGTSVEGLQVCDNVNLEIVLQDFEAYYYARYQTHIKMVKKTHSVSQNDSKVSKGRRVKPRSALVSPSPILEDRIVSYSDCERNRVLQQPGPYSHLEITNEWRILAEAVCKEILVVSPNVQWEDVVGHGKAKQRLQESLVYPIKYPSLYSVVEPWRGLFLYGPSGTGKTMLAKSAATQCEATFFSVSPSAFTSKWRGESEKMIRVLFDLAIAHAPSIIFLDEVDALMGQRLAHEHEASRRFKSELLEQIEGLNHLEQSVFLFAASNFPWDIDSAFLRRLEQRIYVSLPDKEERIEMLRRFLPPKIQRDEVCFETKLDYGEIATLTEGYSGSDLQVLSKEIKIQCIRKVIQKIESERQEGILKVSAPVVTTTDVLKALSTIKPIHSELVVKYQDFSYS